MSQFHVAPSEAKLLCWVNDSIFASQGAMEPGTFLSQWTGIELIEQHFNISGADLCGQVMQACATFLVRSV
jgi:hypothetical protein